MSVIEKPPENWMYCLREGNQVWLCKERRIATTASPYIPSKYYGGGTCGKLFLAFDDYRIDYWLVRDNGNGIDQVPLIRPIEGHLPDSPVQMLSQEAYKLTIRLSALEKQVDKLTNTINMIFSLA